jgi:hypothetical protein
MKKFKGTPGNWQYRKATAKNGSSFRVESKVGEETKKVCNVITRDIDQAESNAKLIAAAPDLLEAIQYYFDVLEEVLGKDWKEKPGHVLSKMLDAVKKATE